MSRELAVPDDGTLTDAAAQRFIAQMRAARKWAGSSSEEEAIKAKRDAEMVRQWARINKVSGAVALEACKLQAAAMRRLAQLGSAHIAGAGRSACEWLGAMSDEEFAALLHGMKYAVAPSKLYNDWRKAETAKHAFRRGVEIGNGAGYPADHMSVIHAATTVLHAAMAGGGVTVAELTEELAHHLDCEISDRTEQSWAMREGIETVVREALRSENISGEAHPDFVTWKDREAGWLRIPWPAATLDQLRWMAEFRQEQARELQEAADTLAILVRDLDAVRAENPALTRLNDLWAALMVLMYGEEEAAARLAPPVPKRNGLTLQAKTPRRARAAAAVDDESDVA